MAHGRPPCSSPCDKFLKRPVSHRSSVPCDPQSKIFPANTPSTMDNNRSSSSRLSISAKRSEDEQRRADSLLFHALYTSLNRKSQTPRASEQIRQSNLTACRRFVAKSREVRSEDVVFPPLLTSGACPPPARHQSTPAANAPTCSTNSRASAFVSISKMFGSYPCPSRLSKLSSGRG